MAGISESGRAHKGECLAHRVPPRQDHPNYTCYSAWLLLRTLLVIISYIAIFSVKKNRDIAADG